jgi:hypothetical protein
MLLHNNLEIGGRVLRTVENYTPLGVSIELGRIVVSILRIESLCVNALTTSAKKDD